MGSDVPTIDKSRQDEVFGMRAAVMWTVNDFPSYDMLSEWSTLEQMVYPIRMEKSKGFYMRHSKKVSFFDRHMKFLPMKHRYHRDRKSFTKGKSDKVGPLDVLSAEDRWSTVKRYGTAVEDLKGKPPGYGKDHKWIKRSIFWELPYWKDHLL